MATVSRRGDAPAGPERQRDAERTRREILEVASGEFARDGYSGARGDEIAAGLHGERGAGEADQSHLGSQLLTDQGDSLVDVVELLFHIHFLGR